jgi:hypothetical protein
VNGYLDELERTLQLVRRSAVLDRLRIVWTASREWPEEHNNVGYGLLSLVVAHYGRYVRLAHGAARGGDQVAARFGPRQGWRMVPYPVGPQEWERFGGWAGHRRNAFMIEAERPDLVIALIYRGSRGATGCADNAAARGVPVLRIDEELALIRRGRATM